MITLRPSRPEDLAFVTGLERRPDHVETIGQWTDLEHLATMQSPKREHWIIEVDGAPCGYLIAYDGRAQDAGIYLKRILVADKDRGTGTLALAKYFDRAFGTLEAKFVWLAVREENARAQAVYRRLGFHRFDPVADVARRLAETAETPGPGAFRMLLKARDWETGGGLLQP
jgi:ribosomal protein S18 acetylase RimI-like enzyme